MSPKIKKISKKCLSVELALHRPHSCFSNKESPLSNKYLAKVIKLDKGHKLLISISWR